MIRMFVATAAAVFATALLAPPASADASYASCRSKELEQDDRGGCVKLLQKTLNQWCKKGSALDVDGIFGPRTRAAVVQFQRHVGPDDEGEADDSSVVGEITWQELEAGNPKETPYINCLSNEQDLPKRKPRIKEPSESTSGGSAPPGVAVTFEKNTRDADNSRLTLWVNGKAQGSWRAGSGHVRDDCAKGVGWLPNGTYPMTWHRNYKGSVVKGYAMYLGNKPCRNGSVTRSELFVHSWDPWTDNSYKSAGCVKLRPGDIAEFYNKWVSLGKPKTKLVVSEGK